ncbi:MAG TPA: DUF1015 domain-containing protein [Solirubrobacterales bacterium]
MVDVRPLEAVHYELRMVGSMGEVTSPPYDVITPEMRAELVTRSPFNVVEVDLPQTREGADPYEHAAETFDEWLLQDVLKRDREPAIWPYAQEFTGPDGRRRTRRGFLARVRLEPYGPGGVRPHERTQPGPKEDRLRLTRATRHNLSPIFALHAGDAWRHLEPALGDTWGEATDGDGTVHRVWRIDEPAVHGAVAAELADSELLIADGHHRYETARAYEAEVGADDEGPHSFVLMSLVSLDDPGLAVFPTHRLLHGFGQPEYEALGAGLRELFEIEEVGLENLDPAGEDGLGVFGYADSHHRRGWRLRLRDTAALAHALPDKPEAYRQLDTVILETLVLRGLMGMSTDDIAAKQGLAYDSDPASAVASIESGERDCLFMLRPTPVDAVREVAASGETMPPKSTYFFPKLLTGIVFNPLS